MRTCHLILASLISFASPLRSQDADKEKDKPNPRINKFVELMEERRPAFGVFSSEVSVRNGANMASSGLDFVIIDLEHAPYDITRLEGYLLGMISKADVVKNGLAQRTVPFVRVKRENREAARRSPRA